MNNKYLINVTETYRVDSESTVEKILEEAKNAKEYELCKYSCVYKETKQKGEVIDSWYRLTLCKSFTSEKEPDRSVNITYENGGYDSAF